jgi:hypothetical protein
MVKNLDISTNIKIFVLNKGDISGDKRAYGSSPLAVWSMAWVCSLLLAGIVDLNTVEDMDVSC